jgi:hypothetical protein
LQNYLERRLTFLAHFYIIGVIKKIEERDVVGGTAEEAPR